MEFNIKKCNVLHVGHGNVKHEKKMRGEVLESVDEETDIGVRMSSNLKPSAQCQKAARTAQTVLSQILSQRKYQKF